MIYSQVRLYIAFVLVVLTLLITPVTAEQPAVDYEALIGGFLLPRGTEVTIDDQSNAYAIGSYYENQVDLDIIVTRVGPDGDIAWTNFIVGDNHDFATDIAVDAEGNIWVTGWTTSSDFPVTSDAFDPVMTHSAAFLMQLSSETGTIIYCTLLGGDHTDRANGLAINDDGEILIVGYTKSTDFPTTADAYQPEPNAPLYIYKDIFISKFSGDGKSLLYSTHFGGYNNDEAIDVSFDSAGNIVVAGSTESGDFPVVNALQSEPHDIFISKFNAAGSELLFSSYLGGEDYDRLWEMELDDHDNIYLCGATRSISFPTTPGVFQENFVGDINGCEVPFGADYNCEDNFLVKLRTDGEGLIFSTFLGGSTVDEAHALGVGPDGSVYLTGSTSSADFPGTVNEGLYYISRLSSDGVFLDFTYRRYSSNSGGMGITVAYDGAIYTTGGVDYPAQMYVAKFNNREAADVTDDSIRTSQLRLAVDGANPFAGAARVTYSLPEPGSVQLSVIDIGGRVVQALSNEFQPAGTHSVYWDGTNRSGVSAPSGVYYYVLDWNGRQAAERALLLR
jgi:FlgD Ig-like domain/Beta-propeller repeat